MMESGEPGEIVGVAVEDDILNAEEHDDSVEGDDVAPPVPEPDLVLNENDPIPTAGAADIGGLPGGLD